MFSRTKAAAAPTMPKIDVSTRTDVKLGQTVRECVTGFTGIVTVISHEIDGTVMIGVQPRALDNGKPAEAYEFDIERVSVIEDGDSVLNNNAAAVRDTVRLGAVYRDRVTMFEGVAVRVIDFLGGCARITLRPKVDKDGKIQDPILIPVEQAEMISEGISEEVKKTATKTGGPGTSEKRMMERMGR